MNFFGLYVNEDYINPSLDFDENEKWKKILFIVSYITGKMPHELFDDPNWNETIMWDIDIILFGWNEVLQPLFRGRI